MNYGSGSSKRPESIKEAIRMVDEALSRSAGFNELKSAVSEMSADAVEGLREFSSKAMESIEDAMGSGREVFQYVDSKMRANPWPIIGGVALGAFLLGLAVGTERRPERKTDSGYRH